MRPSGGSDASTHRSSTKGPYLDHRRRVATTGCEMTLLQAAYVNQVVDMLEASAQADPQLVAVASCWTLFPGARCGRAGAGTYLQFTTCAARGAS